MNAKRLTDIALKYGTPTYVFFESELSALAAKIRKSFPEGTKLCFAMKANPFLVGSLSRMTDGLEVCSPGEYEICIRENISPEKIVVSGVNKTEETITRILSYSHGQGIYTIESPYQYEILKKCAEKEGVVLKVLIRLSSKNQFGVDRECLESLLEKIIKDDSLEFVGIHYYSGTQKKSDKIAKELKMLDEYAKELKEKFGGLDMELEYGPGLGATYFEGEEFYDSSVGGRDELLEAFGDMLKSVKEFGSISIELGRFLTSDCGVYLTKIMDIKKTYDMGYMIVDGGINQLNYYGQLMGMKVPRIELLKLSDKEADSGIDKWTICGSLCTVNDVLVRGVEKRDYALGDVLAFFKCGAYSVTEGMALFLSRELPRVLLVKNDDSIELLREKTEIYNKNTREEM